MLETLAALEVVQLLTAACLINSADKYLNSLLTLLEANPDYIIKEDVPEVEETDKDLVPQNGEPVYIQGSLVAFIDRLDDEFTKSLQNIDPHTTDYVDRLKDEVGLYSVIVRSQAYFTRIHLTDSISRTTMRRLEHLYFKVSSVFAQITTAKYFVRNLSLSSNVCQHSAL